MELKVQVKQAGQRGNKITAATLFLKKTPQDIAELLTYSVQANHALHNKRIKQLEAFEKGDLNSAIVYTQEELTDASVTGKIDFSFLKSSANVTESQAIETALQAFEDGLIAIFIDGTRYETLSDSLSLTGNETITFVKLTMLSGRMW